MSYFPKKFSILKTLFSKNYSIEKFLNKIQNHLSFLAVCFFISVIGSTYGS